MINKLRTRLATSGGFLSVVFFPLIDENVSAYIDAGTGSLIIQFLIASAVGGLFLIKVFWKKIKAFVSNLFSRANKSAE